MRIDRLDITAFGRLRDVTLDLHPALTAVLGPNEAGKTTVLRAVRAALYGLDAGGQGRPRARSDWARWRPWERAERYGLSLTYTLSDGSRIRVARRLEELREEAQVVEVGGRDMTETLRVGRLVVPGWHHLGIDEAVFCATACLGEESLRTDSPDAALARADRLQEAIERLADSASRATAAEALARLRHAMDRVGTEGRSRSPLGLASARLRQLEEELGSARARQDAVGAEQDRLRRLDALAVDADGRRVDAERQWLEARLAALAATRDEVGAARAEEARLEARIGAWEGFATFPAELEDRVLALAAELRQADGALQESAQRWEEGRGRMRAVERRRAEVATSLTALGSAPHVGPQDRELLA
ncbi:MAG TPA: AAA family ATPase, partial [Candidatus Dormibacteraeota bacterium]|nr:AAA family ATPase [Candidatus Dormibacteraeota bacterium]